MPSRKEEIEDQKNYIVSQILKNDYISYSSFYILEHEKSDEEYTKQLTEQKSTFEEMIQYLAEQNLDECDFQSGVPYSVGDFFKLKHRSSELGLTHGRIYLSPSINNTPLIAKHLTEELLKKDMPFYFKIRGAQNYNERLDQIVIYIHSLEELGVYSQALKELTTNYPQLFENCKKIRIWGSSLKDVSKAFFTPDPPYKPYGEENAISTHKNQIQFSGMSYGMAIEAIIKDAKNILSFIENEHGNLDLNRRKQYAEKIYDVLFNGRYNLSLENVDFSKNNKVVNRYFPIKLFNTPNGSYLMESYAREENVHLKIFTSSIDYLTSFFKDTKIDTFPTTPNCIELALSANDYETLLNSESKATQFIEKISVEKEKQVNI